MHRNWENAMTREEAIELVKSFRYKEGWEWSVAELFIPQLDRIDVLVTCIVPDSTPNSDRRVQVGHNVTIRLEARTTAEEVENAFFAGLALAEMHEMREHFRREDLTAPFHPHRTDGTERWISSGREQVAHTISRSVS
jgi:hypothetical protein